MSRPLGTIHMLHKHFYRTKLNLTKYLIVHKYWSNPKELRFQHYILTQILCCSWKFQVHKEMSKKIRENVRYIQMAYATYESAPRAQQQNSAASEPKVGVEPPMPTLASTSRNDFSGWNLLCQAIDRVLFLSYLVIILIFIASYLGGATLASQT